MVSRVRLGARLAPRPPLLAVTIFLNYFYLSAMVTLVQEQVRADQRVMSGALLLLVMNFIGLGLGPTYVGSISQFFRATHPQNSLQIALYALTPFYLVAVFLFLMLARVLRRECCFRRNCPMIPRAASVCLFFAALAYRADAVTAHPPAGKLQGRLEGQVRVFKGIPYAMPPVGAARWKPRSPCPAGRASGTRRSSDRPATSHRPSSRTSMRAIRCR